MRRALLLALAATCLLQGPVRAESFTPAQRNEIVGIVRDALKRDPTILRDALMTLQADEARSRDQAQSDTLRRLASQLVLPTDPVEGNPRGDVTMVEFFDTRCPYCRRMLPDMAKLLTLEPNLRLVLKDLPILGPTSTLESRALLAAQRQGGYARMRDAIMTTGAPSTPDTLRATADRLGLDGNRLLADMNDPAIQARLDANLALARQLDIQGTPALVVGQQIIAGEVAVDAMQQAIADARKTQ